MAGSSPHSFGTVWVQQAFGELNWKTWRLNIGIKEDYISLLDAKLSSGDFSLSNNARPAPEIKLSFPDFVVVPFTKDRLYIRAHFALGKFLDGNYLEDTAKAFGHPYMKGTLSHHKSFFFRFGNFEKGCRFRFTASVDHHAQWGGERFHKDKTRKNPRGISDFFRVLTARGGGSKSPEGDQLYVAGSHVGSYTFMFEHQLRNKDQLSLYWHHFFEDASGLAIQNYRDMMLGLQYKRKGRHLVSNVLFEYIFTKHQTGPIHFNEQMDDEHIGTIKNKGNGRDDYYNNYDYSQGRSHYGRSLGTPLLLSPEYNKDGRLHFKSNRIVAFHLGVEGYLHRDLQYRLLVTHGQTWGRYNFPYIHVKEGLATGLDIKYSPANLKDYDFKLSAGLDLGKFFQGNSFGAGISFVKRGVILSR